MGVVVYRQVSQEQDGLKTEVSCRSVVCRSLNIINQRYPIRKETKLLLVDGVVRSYSGVAYDDGESYCLLPLHHLLLSQALRY